MAKVIKFDNNTYLYGTIIETGSNSNGNYIKYSDGTIICSGLINVGNISYTRQYGSIWLDNNGTMTLTFPFTFDNANDIYSVNLSIASIGGGVGGVCGQGYTRTQYSFYLWHATQYTLTTIVSFQVIGKWR